MKVSIKHILALASLTMTMMSCSDAKFSGLGKTKKTSTSEEKSGDSNKEEAAKVKPTGEEPVCNAQIPFDIGASELDSDSKEIDLDFYYMEFVGERLAPGSGGTNTSVKPGTLLSASVLKIGDEYKATCNMWGMSDEKILSKDPEGSLYCGWTYVDSAFQVSLADGAVVVFAQGIKYTFKKYKC